MSVPIWGHNNRMVIEKGVHISERFFILICDFENPVHQKKNSTVVSMGISVADNENFVFIGENGMILNQCRIMTSDFRLHNGIRRKYLHKG